MSEVIFDISVNSEKIHGIWHRPAVCRGNASNGIAVIILHGWAGYRTGPHDMLVKMARNLTGKGYHCFRFDFRGKGYSQGDRRQTNNKTMLEDLESILQYVHQVMDQPQIVLAGICSGAKLALYYARNGNLPVMHVIEMSSPVLRQNEVETALAANQAKANLKEYAKKAFRMETWKKFMDGEVHFRAIWRNIARPIKRLLAKRGKMQVRAPHAVSKTREKPFSRFAGQMLLIHGEKDPETEPALKQIHEMLDRYRVPADTHIVKGANHSFYSINWEKEIIKLIEDWLGNRSQTQSTCMVEVHNKPEIVTC
jgi:pimeloyl-ACP methyl ester carboxylesterase